MPTKIDIKTFFKGVQNRDNDARVIGDGEYIRLVNGRIGRSEEDGVGALENSLGNTAITTFVDADAVVLGSYRDVGTNQIYYFIHGTEEDAIYEYSEDTDTFTPLVRDDRTPSLLNFDVDHLITGINIVGENVGDEDQRLLLWTDNLNPPRKINISRAKTRFNGGLQDSNGRRITDEFISVVKTPPLISPLVEEVRLPDNPLASPQSELDPFLDGSNLDLTIERKRELVEELVSLIRQEGNLEEKFVRFSYRWVYEDNEYSALAPFSEVPFRPGEFNVDSNRGVLEGMVNQIKAVDISFNTGPREVTEIELVYKEDGQNEIYVVESYNKFDRGWRDNVDLSPDNITTGERSIRFSSQKLYRLLPSRELTRVYDAVPLRAQAQEIVDNRVVYGNYVDQYDLVDIRKEYDAEGNLVRTHRDPIVVSLNARRAAPEDLGIGGGDQAEEAERNATTDVTIPEGPGYDNLKSDRDYEVGIVYLDDIGRQTPVLTSQNNTVHIPAENANKINRITVDIESKAPEFATGYRFFIKQTKGQFYNIFPISVPLADTNDLNGNFVWIRIPDADQEKVKAGDYLNLKVTDPESMVETGGRELFRVDAVEAQGVNFLETAVPEEGENVVIRQSAGIYMRLEDTRYFFAEATSLQETTENDIRFQADFTSNNSSQSPVVAIDTTQSEAENMVRRENLPTSYREETIYYPNVFSTERDERPEEESLLVTGDYTITPTTGVNGDAFSGSIRFEFQIMPSIAENNVRVGWRYWIGTRSGITVSELNIINVPLRTSATDSAPASIALVHGLSFRLDDIRDAASTTDALWTVEDYAPGDRYTFVARRSANILWGRYEDDDSKKGDDNPNRSDERRGFTSRKANAVLKLPEGRIPQGSQFQLGVEDGFGSFDGTPIALQFNKNNFVAERDYANVEEWFFEEGLWNPQNPTGGLTGSGQNPGSGGTIFEQIGFWRGNVSENRVIRPFRDFGDISAADAISTALNPLGFISGNLEVSGTTTRWQIVHDTNGELGMVINSGTYNPRGNKNSAHKRMSVEFFFSPGNVADFPYAFETQPEDGLLDLYYEIPDTFSCLNGVHFGNEMSDHQVITYVDADGNTAQTSTRGNRNDTSQSIGINGNLRRTIGSTIYQASGFDGLGLGESTNSFNVSLPDGLTLGGTPTTTSGGTIYTTGASINGQSTISLSIGGVGFEGLPISLLTDYAFTGDLQGYDNSGAAMVVTLTEAQVDSLRPLGFFDSETSSTTQDVFLFRADQVELYLSPTIPRTDRNAAGDVIPLTETRTISKITVNLDYTNCFAFSNGVESASVRDEFLGANLAAGGKVSTVSQRYRERRNISNLIYSQPFNAQNGVNGLNDFSSSEAALETIIEELDISDGSIQKLFSRDTDLIVFQEDKVNKVLVNKDQLVNADGSSNITSTESVLGQTIPYTGEFGISKNPESFAVYGRRIYFSDKNRGVVLRLSEDGLTEISNYGMRDFFRDEFATDYQVQRNGVSVSRPPIVIGSYDDYHDQYVISTRSPLESPRLTLETQPLLLSKQAFLSRTDACEYPENDLRFTQVYEFYTESGTVPVFNEGDIIFYDQQRTSRFNGDNDWFVFFQETRVGETLGSGSNPVLAGSVVDNTGTYILSTPLDPVPAAGQEVTVSQQASGRDVLARVGDVSNETITLIYDEGVTLTSAESTQAAEIEFTMRNKFVIQIDRFGFVLDKLNCLNIVPPNHDAVRVSLRSFISPQDACGKGIVARLVYHNGNDPSPDPGDSIFDSPFGQDEFFEGNYFKGRTQKRGWYKMFDGSNLEDYVINIIQGRVVEKVRCAEIDAGRRRILTSEAPLDRREGESDVRLATRICAMLPTEENFHDGENPLPVPGDTMYADNFSNSPLRSGFYAVEGGYYVELSSTGVVVTINPCTITICVDDVISALLLDLQHNNMNSFIFRGVGGVTDELPTIIGTSAVLGDMNGELVFNGSITDLGEFRSVNALWYYQIGGDRPTERGLVRDGIQILANGNPITNTGSVLFGTGNDNTIEGLPGLADVYNMFAVRVGNILVTTDVFTTRSSRTADPSFGTFTSTSTNPVAETEISFTVTSTSQVGDAHTYAILRDGVIVDSSASLEAGNSTYTYTISSYNGSMDGEYTAQVIFSDQILTSPNTITLTERIPDEPRARALVAQFPSGSRTASFLPDVVDAQQAEGTPFGYNWIEVYDDVGVDGDAELNDPNIPVLTSFAFADTTQLSGVGETRTATVMGSAGAGFVITPSVGSPVMGTIPAGATMVDADIVIPVQTIGDPVRDITFNLTRQVGTAWDDPVGDRTTTIEQGVHEISINITFDNQVAGTTIAGTFSIPSGVPGASFSENFTWTTDDEVFDRFTASSCSLSDDGGGNITCAVTGSTAGSGRRTRNIRISGTYPSADVTSTATFTGTVITLTGNPNSVPNRNRLVSTNSVDVNPDVAATVSVRITLDGFNPADPGQITQVEPGGGGSTTLTGTSGSRSISVAGGTRVSYSFDEGFHTIETVTLTLSTGETATTVGASQTYTL